MGRPTHVPDPDPDVTVTEALGDGETLADTLGAGDEPFAVLGGGDVACWGSTTRPCRTMSRLG
jgi:hypothetical protein